MIERRYYQLYICAGDGGDAPGLATVADRLNAALVDCGYYDDAPEGSKDACYRQARDLLAGVEEGVGRKLAIRARVILRCEPERLPVRAASAR